jgi:NAD-dependent dihydropyrimidine dehydrogenase PreA subunit
MAGYNGGGMDVKRSIIAIDEASCNGCGQCIPNCPEGAIQLIDGKARLISDLMCDGLGACLGHCPEGAIAIEEREAESYDEVRVMANIARQGTNTIRAHLAHLQEHGQREFLEQAIGYLQQNGIPIPDEKEILNMQQTGCPGSRSMAIEREDAAVEALAGKRPSQLSHWPVQMHLLSPSAPHYQGSDLVLAADCVAYALGDFHKDYLHGKTLGIACPKLDEGQEVYVEKLKALIDEARINTLTVAIMQVPCCRGLLFLAQQAAAQASRKVPIKAVVVGVQGQVVQEEWLG